MNNIKDLKYQYNLQLWGGFYNDQYQKIHGYKEGDYVFDTELERSTYLKNLEKISEDLNAKMLMSVLSEGFNCHTRTVGHRVVEWEGKQYYSTRDFGVNYPFRAAVYMLEWKWTPGFNDYPLGEDFDYENNKVTIIQEWITGAFDISKED